MALSIAVQQSDLSTLAESWRLSLRAANRSPKTIKVYLEALRFLDRYLRQQGMPTSLAGIKREHVESYIAGMLAAGRRPAYASNHYRSLQQFFRWALEEGEISVSPMARMKAPTVPLEPPAIVTDEQLTALLAACAGKDFADRRDTAILRVLIDTGMRRAECAGIKVSDVDFEQAVIVVLGKGRRPRACPVGARTLQALDRYRRIRPQHKHARLPAFWLGRDGALTVYGVEQLVERRAREANLPHIHLHQLRHTAAHVWLASGGSETDAMRLFGWKSREMLGRYGASVADERARESHRRLAPGDRV